MEPNPTPPASLWPAIGARARRRAIALGVVLAVALLAWFGGRVDLAAVGAALGAARPSGIALAIALQLLVQPLRGLRWRALLAGHVRVPRRTAIAATWIGWTVHAYVPLRVGELVRPLVLARRHQVDVPFALGTQLLERALDLGAVLALLAVGLRWGPRAASRDAGEVRGALEHAQSVGVPLALVALLVAVLAVAASPRLRRLERRLIERLPAGARRLRLLGLGRSLAAGATTVRSPRAIARAVAETAVVWGVAIAAHAALFHAFGLEPKVGGIALLLVLVVASSLVPTPAGVGSYHAAVQLALATLLGVPLATATAYAIAAHAIAVVPHTLVGLALVAREGWLPATRAAAGSAAAEPPGERLEESVQGQP